ncbi:OmpW family protein [Idiomarina sp.]|uniref:OmpW/AlkL family protein n=1 Tax=Idiomarina sp. TaxID=1874361 RepID=UPI003516F399
MKRLTSAVALATLFAASFAQAQDFSINVGAISVIPDDSSSSLNTVEQVAGLPANSTGVAVNTNTQLGLTFDYQWENGWGLELVAATPFSHDIYGSGTLSGLSIGKTKHLPPTLFVQYHWDTGVQGLEPFVGLGVNYTTFFDDQASSELTQTLQTLGVAGADDSVDLALSNSWGAAIQAGVNWQISERWGAQLMVSHIDIDTTASVRLNGSTIEQTDVAIDPYVAMIALRYTF